MRLIVRPHRPKRQLLLAAISISLVVLGVWLLLDYGPWQVIDEGMTISTEQKALLRHNSELQRKNSKLSQKLDVAQRSAKIDEQAYAHLRITVAKLQTRLQELTEELDFYRGILASTRNARGLQVQGMRVEPLGEAGHYRFKLVLTHVVKNDIVAEGTVTVAFEGNEGGQPKQLMLRNISGPGTSDLSFKFQHFRSIEGTFKLPHGFNPKQVRVAVSQKGRSAKIERTFGWDQLVE